LRDLPMGSNRDKPAGVGLLSVPARRYGPPRSPLCALPAATGAALPRVRAERDRPAPWIRARSRRAL